MKRHVVVARAGAKRRVRLRDAALSAFAAAVLLSSGNAFAEEKSPSSLDTRSSQPQPAAQVASAGPTSISFTRVDPSVAKKLEERDQNMAWKCRGVSMYDCDGELAAAAEKRFEDMSSMFRESSR